MPVDAQKLLNWIVESDNLNDFEMMGMTIMGGRENPAGKFPQQQMAVYPKDVSRRSILSKGISGLIKQIADGKLGVPILPERLPTLIVCKTDASQKIIEVAKWEDTEDWSFKIDNYWIVAEWDTSQEPENKFQWVVVLPRRGMKNANSVRYIQPVSAGELSMDTEIETALNGMMAYLNGGTSHGSITYHLAKINFAALKTLS